MRRGKKLLCLGVAISILGANAAFGESYIPPNPLTGSTSGTFGDLYQGPGYPGTWPGDPSGNGTIQQPGNGSVQQPETNAGQQPGNGSVQQPDTNTSQPAGVEGGQQGEASAQLPVVEAEGAVLLDCKTGQVLFEKNGYNQFFPASITKIMTALLTVENCNLNDIVTFSETATTLP